MGVFSKEIHKRLLGSERFLNTRGYKSLTHVLEIDYLKFICQLVVADKEVISHSETPQCILTLTPSWYFSRICTSKAQHQDNMTPKSKFPNATH